MARCTRENRQRLILALRDGHRVQLIGPLASSTRAMVGIVVTFATYGVSDKLYTNAFRKEELPAKDHGD